MSRHRQRFYQRVEPERVHGPVALNTIGMAVSRATLLTKSEITHYLQPGRDGFERMRKAQATEADWVHLVSICSIALAVEEQGVVRGLLEVLTEADLALAAIGVRAMASGKGWRAPTLYASELQQLQALLRMHEFQLSKISWGEHRRAWQHATKSVVARGGRAIKALALEASES